MMKKTWKILFASLAVVSWLGTWSPSPTIPSPTMAAETVIADVQPNAIGAILAQNTVDDKSGGESGGEDGSTSDPEWRYVPVRRYG